MLQKKISAAEFNKIYVIKALREALDTSLVEYRRKVNDINKNESLFNNKSIHQFTKLQLLKNELTKITKSHNIPEFNYLTDLTQSGFNQVTADSLAKYLDRLDKLFSKISNSTSDRRDRFYNMNSTKLKKLENEYYNFKLFELVTKPYEREKILIYRNSLVQNIDPVFLDPDKKGILGFRTHFYAPSKYIFGVKTDTFVFNISLVFLSTILLYLLLYFELPGKVVRFFENFKFRKNAFNALLICFFILLY
jgi:hypothetical protein